MSFQKQSKTLYILAIGFQMGFSIALPILAFVFLGFWIDENFHLTPWGSLVGLIIGLSMSIYSVYYLLKPLFEKNGKK